MDEIWPGTSSKRTGSTSRTIIPYVIFLAEVNGRLIQKFFQCQHIARVIKYVLENFVTEEKAVEAETFFREHEFPGTERTIQQSVEQIRLNAAWLKRDAAKVGEFLKMY
jgi:puromycin-sensitive aminopeptidase